MKTIKSPFSNNSISNNSISNNFLTNNFVTNKNITIFAVTNIIIILVMAPIINPFVFGKAAEGEYFTDRQEDAKRLTANLTHGINTILISPRRWGKTSLVKKVVSEIDHPEIKTVFLDIFQCKSEWEFYHAFATAIIKQTATKLEEWVEMAKTFLSSISPKFTFGPDPMSDFSITFDWDKKDDSYLDILQLPEKIAQKRGIRLLICLDEFQQMAKFADAVTFQKRLRSVWQHQQHVTYCMFGSKKHLMENMFNDQSMPFYKFGDLMFLKKIPTHEWVAFICAKFQETGKTITEQQARKICEATENLSSYVQQLSWVVWYKSGETVTNGDINEAIDDLLEQNKVFFQREVEQLTELQLNFLRAMAAGVTNGFSRKDIIKKYRLESSANIQAIKKSLLKRDLIDVDGDKTSFNDSLFKLWLKRQHYYN